MNQANAPHKTQRDVTTLQRRDRAMSGFGINAVPQDMTGPDAITLDADTYCEVSEDGDIPVRMGDAENAYDQVGLEASPGFIAPEHSIRVNSIPVYSIPDNSILAQSILSQSNFVSHQFSA